MCALLLLSPRTGQRRISIIPSLRRPNLLCKVSTFNTRHLNLTIPNTIRIYASYFAAIFIIARATIIHYPLLSVALIIASCGYCIFWATNWASFHDSSQSQRESQHNLNTTGYHLKRSTEGGQRGGVRAWERQGCHFLLWWVRARGCFGVIARVWRRGILQSSSRGVERERGRGEATLGDKIGSIGTHLWQKEGGYL